MRCKSLCIILAGSLMVAACTPAQPEVKTNTAYRTLPPAADQSMLSLGRGLSSGTVDIYEPGTPAFSVTEQKSFVPPVATVPENANLIVRDRSVTVFSLDSNATSAPLYPAAEQAYVPPAPRRYASELMPTNQSGQPLN